MPAVASPIFLWLWSGVDKHCHMHQADNVLLIWNSNFTHSHDSLLLQSDSQASSLCSVWGVQSHEVPCRSITVKTPKSAPHVSLSSWPFFWFQRTLSLFLHYFWAGHTICLRCLLLPRCKVWMLPFVSQSSLEIRT